MTKAAAGIANGAPLDARASIRDQALALGFDIVGFAAAAADPSWKQDLGGYLAAGHHGDMGWMDHTAERRADPQTLWPEARSIVAVGLNYGPADDPLAALQHRDRGVVSVYARNRDYHDVLKKRLRQLARWMHGSLECEVKLFVDTAPVMEKPVAARAGLGWQGKHTNLVSRQFGSWLFLGEIFTDLDLRPDVRESDHCGTCTHCQDVCPTNAFPAPYRIDARRCISYLTIEHKGHIAPEFRVPIGNRIYGCDDCLAVCPWNKFAATGTESAFSPRAELTAPRLADLATLDEAAFRTFFSGSPIKRIGRDRFMRNVLIALGNSGDRGNSDNRVAVAAIEPHLDDASPLVRAMAVWALRRLLDDAAFDILRRRHADAETDAEIIAEWNG